MPRVAPVLLLWLVASASAAAQRRERDETLFDGWRGQVGFAAGPAVTLTEAFGRSAVLAGGRAGVVFGRRLAVGIAAAGGVQALDGGPRVLPAFPESGGPICIAIYPPPPWCVPFPWADPEVAWRYGGLDVQVVDQPHRLLHWTAGVLVGGGTAELRTPHWYGPGVIAVNDDPFVVVEPSAGLQLNLFAWLRADLAVAYRFVRGFALDALGRPLADGDLSGTALTLTLRGGRF